MAAICAALYHSRIELLDLEENSFTVEGFIPLARVLRQQLWLRRLLISATSSSPQASSVVSTSVRAALRRNTTLLSLSDSAATRGCRPFLDRNHSGNYQLDYHLGSLVELSAVALLQHALLYDPDLLRNLVVRSEFASIPVLDPLRTLVEFGFPSEDFERKRMVAILRYHYMNPSSDAITSTELSPREMLARLRHTGIPNDLESGINKLRKLYPDYCNDDLLTALEEAAGDVTIASTNIRGFTNTVRKTKTAK